MFSHVIYPVTYRAINVTLKSPHELNEDIYLVKVMISDVAHPPA